MSDEPLIAVFIDFENLAIGVRHMQSGRFQIELVLKRLLEKGRIVFKRAYCDWRNYEDSIREFHTQGIELIDIPQSKMSGKNSADIRMVVDALDLCYSKQQFFTAGFEVKGKQQARRGLWREKLDLRFIDRQL
jgi:hypothetical protein